MASTELGSGFRAPKRSDDFITQLQADITDAVLAALQPQIARLIPQMPAPVVNVSPPVVNVSSPSIEIPEQDTINCTVEMPGIDRLVSVLNDIKGLLSASVTRSVTRDSNGLIKSVMETR